MAQTNFLIYPMKLFTSDMLRCKLRNTSFCILKKKNKKTVTYVSSLSCLLSEPTCASDEVHQYKQFYVRSFRYVLQEPSTDSCLFFCTFAQKMFYSILFFYLLTVSTIVIVRCIQPAGISTNQRVECQLSYQSSYVIPFEFYQSVWRVHVLFSLCLDSSSPSVNIMRMRTTVFFWMKVDREQSWNGRQDNFQKL